MATGLSNEMVERQGSSGPAAFDAQVRVQTVQSGGLITAVVSDEQRTYLQPETLPQGPLQMPRRRARR